MSKKSRRRNRKILGALTAIGLGLAARNKRNKAIETGIQSAEDDSGSDMLTTIPKKKPIISTPVTTKTTIMDSMPKVGMKKGDIRPKNEKSKRIQKNTNKVYTIEGAKKGIEPKVGNVKSIFKGDDGYLRSGVDATPMTTGRFGTYKASKEMERGMLPPQLRVPKVRTPYTGSMSGLADNDFAAKDGGRAKLKSGGKVKGCGKALRGFGRAMKGKK
jgi:hypothetical protein